MNDLDQYEFRIEHGETERSTLSHITLYKSNKKVKALELPDVVLLIKNLGFIIRFLQIEGSLKTFYDKLVEAHTKLLDIQARRRSAGKEGDKK